MNPTKQINALFVGLLLTTYCFSQGSSCSDAYTINLDGVCRNFTANSITGNALFCTLNGYSGTNGRVTYFQFTTDDKAQCVLIDVQASTPVTMEIVMYDDCSGGTPLPAGGVYVHGMCMTDGAGLWSQNLFNNLLPLTKYYLRIRTEAGYGGNLTVCGKYYTPPNADCLGATPISALPVSDNNACHTPADPSLAPSLCATTLENTAWYSFIVQADGSSTITIENISCDNGNGNNTNGFQIGFFAGPCDNLKPLTCSNGVGGTVQATANGLTAGSLVYVAIDGYSGSNCAYTVRASNSQPLAVYMKYFEAWKDDSKNLLKWTTLQEFNNVYFEIQRSTDGKNFEALTRIPGERHSLKEKHYTYNDHNPPLTSYYRLKQVDLDGKISYSRTVKVAGTQKANLKLLPVSQVYSQLQVNISSPSKTRLRLSLIDLQGRLIYANWVDCHKGINSYSKDVSNLASGQYVLILDHELERISRPVLISRRNSIH